MTRLDAGARWLRCDLHVHTPFDPEKRFGENIGHAIDAFRKEKPQRLAEIAMRFVEACRKAAGGEGIDLVGVTDHNSIEGYRYLRPRFDVIAQQAKPGQGRPGLAALLIRGGPLVVCPNPARMANSLRSGREPW